MPYADFNSSGTLLTRYVSGPGMVNGAAVDELLARTSSGGTSAWYLTDKLDSVRDVVNSSGSAIDHVVYDSFGSITTETNAGNGDRFKFASMEYDATTKKYFDRARWFAGVLGRFNSVDPMAFRAGDANLFRYVNNDPGESCDPSGYGGGLPPDMADTDSAGVGMGSVNAQPGNGLQMSVDTPTRGGVGVEYPLGPGLGTAGAAFAYMNFGQTSLKVGADGNFHFIMDLGDGLSVELSPPSGDHDEGDDDDDDSANEMVDPELWELSFGQDDPTNVFRLPPTDGVAPPAQQAGPHILGTLSPPPTGGNPSQNGLKVSTDPVLLAPLPDPGLPTTPGSQNLLTIDSGPGGVPEPTTMQMVAFWVKVTYYPYWIYKVNELIRGTVGPK
jgi:RHS repeat-associated protein